ncbi:MAG: helix-turn-helix transcriptional regulator [Holdemanella sp.]|nr:helix-turn-helix transcriptional regulator [Holdemanella sp.]
MQRLSKRSSFLFPSGKSRNELSEIVGVSNVNLSKMKTGKISAVRFSTLEAICEALNCQPGDILEYDPNAK